jgi:hypothetical protein
VLLPDSLDEAADDFGVLLTRLKKDIAVQHLHHLYED